MLFIACEDRVNLLQNWRLFINIIIVKLLRITSLLISG
jgi:hypothetical protein